MDTDLFIQDIDNCMGIPSPEEPRYNPILDVDSYKTSHFAQYPADAEYVSSYIESRGSECGWWDHTTVNGYTPWLFKYASKPIEAWMIDKAEARLKKHGPSFNRAGWEYILKQHRGHVPIYIEAVPEGLNVPTAINEHRSKSPVDDQLQGNRGASWFLVSHHGGDSGFSHQEIPEIMD
jgi:nicotinic acid phosphoribosyltransferase